MADAHDGGERLKPTRGAGVVRFRKSNRRGGELVRARCSGCGVLGPEASGADVARDIAREQGWYVGVEKLSGRERSGVVCRCPSCSER